MSLRAASRLADMSINTVTKLLVDVGMASADYQDRTLRNLKCKHIRCDEICPFVYAKEKNVPAEKKGQFGYGDVWTWTAIDAETKLVPSFMIGNRDARSARMFIDDLASRLATRVQLTTDGLKVYLEAVEGAFGCDIDYAMLANDQYFERDPIPNATNTPSLSTPCTVRATMESGCMARP